MHFRIADTFTDSLSDLNRNEQKAVKTTAFDLQMNPASPGMRFHKLDRARDKNFWSVRVNRDIRLIVHKTEASLLLCYVDHHDDAYAWAERRKIERHPRTGAAQLVEVRETVEEITIPKYIEVEESPPPKPALFADVADDDLLGFGVPSEWLDDVKMATEDSLFEIAEHLPQEAAEALLDLATGVQPTARENTTADANPFDHPDAQRRFRVVTNVEELERALDYPWEKWTVFLHPAQRSIVERSYNGPARVAGSAGTGKTIVALHRAVHLARSNPEAKVLLTTFSDTLARALRTRLDRLAGNEPDLRGRIDVESLCAVGERLYREFIGEPQPATDDVQRELLSCASAEAGNHSFSDRFLWTEWHDVVDSWQLDSWEDYRDVQRIGRKTRLAEKQRQSLWTIFENMLGELERSDLVTVPTMFRRVTEHLSASGSPPYAFAVVDEAQDVGVAELRFLAALGAGRPNSLFFAGDLGQRIFQTPFSWKSLGVDIRGRSHTLRINYRTSHQIRKQADRLLPPEMSDVDGNKESRRGTVSVFDGPKPLVAITEADKDEREFVGTRIRQHLEGNIQPHEIGVFVRSEAELPRAKAAVEFAGVPWIELSNDFETVEGQVAISTMHLAKGLEFRAVIVMACDDEIIPLQSRIESVTDESDLEETYNTERHLLYVACTRARDHLTVVGIDPGSEFLDDMCDTGSSD